MSGNGINRLIVVTQMKSDNANEEALHGADKQRGLIKAQKDLRGQQRALDDKLRTVLWGWAGDPITPDEQSLVALVASLSGPLAPGPTGCA